MLSLFNEPTVTWTLILVVSSLFSLYLSYYSFERKSVNGALELALSLLFSALYALAYVLEINGYILSRITEYLRWELFFSPFTAPVFLLFIIRYVRQKPPPCWVYIFILTLSLFFGILGLTHDRHPLLLSKVWLIEENPYPTFGFETGIMNRPKVLYLITTSAVGELLILIRIFQCRGRSRKQAILILAGSMVPTITAALYPRMSNQLFSLQPLALMITGLFIAVALFRYHMLDLLGIARETAMDHIEDGMLVIDREYTLLDLNRSAQTMDFLIDCQRGNILSPKNEFCKKLLKQLDDFDPQGPPGLFYYDSGPKKYELSVNVVQSMRLIKESGFVILLRDVTHMTDLIEELEQQAILDPLTNVYNRRQWMSLARRELEKAKRDNYSLTVMMVDLDHFKRINDSYGHKWGDEVLKQVARKVLNTLRATEIFGRYGGEEFCLICENTDGDAGKSIAERIRKTIEAIEIDIEGKQLNLTASIGLYSTNNLEDLALSSLIHYADLALYQAKEDGRNCCRNYIEVEERL